MLVLVLVLVLGPAGMGPFPRTNVDSCLSRKDSVSLKTSLKGDPPMAVLFREVNRDRERLAKQLCRVESTACQGPVANASPDLHGSFHAPVHLGAS